jgi:hypothetical protein
MPSSSCLARVDQARIGLCANQGLQQTVPVRFCRMSTALAGRC